MNELTLAERIILTQVALGVGALQARFIIALEDGELDGDVVGETEPAAKSLKALPDDPRDAAERRLREALIALFARLAPAIAKRIAAGEEITDDLLAEGLRLGIEPHLVEAATAEGLRLGAEIGVQFDPAILSHEAVLWARQYQFDLIKDLTATTRKVVQDAIATFAETPGMTRAELEALLSPAFGEARASLIASSEVTRAASQAVNQYQAQVGEYGISMLRRWQTLRDSKVCPICGPLHNKLETEWAERYPDGPPSHPACRCSLSLVSVDPDAAKAVSPAALLSANGESGTLGEGEGAP